MKGDVRKQKCNDEALEIMTLTQNDEDNIIASSACTEYKKRVKFHL